MDFGLSAEQELLQQTLRTFVENECPAAHVRKRFDAGHGHDPDLWHALAEMGIPGLVVPEVYGGSGLEVLDLALVAEVLGEGAVPVPLLGHALAALALVEGGSEEQKSRWLPALADGSRIASIALAEADSAWEPDSWRAGTRAGALSGHKLAVPHADVADCLVVGVEGGGLALVETSASGVKIESQASLDRTRPLARVDFDAADCEVLSADPRVAQRLRDVGLVLISADAFGSAIRIVDMTVGYAKTREQFGRKIAEFQGVKHQLARLGLAIEPTRGLVWHGAYAVDHLPDEAERAVALAKAHLTDVSADVARMAVELHGGLGFTWECDVQVWLKRVLFDRAFLGTPEALRDRCAALAGW